MDRIHRMSRGRKTLLSLLLVGVIGAVAGIGTFSAFSATTVNSGNVFDAGTVSISDNDAGQRDVHHRERDAGHSGREMHRRSPTPVRFRRACTCTARPSARSGRSSTCRSTRAPEPARSRTARTSCPTPAPNVYTGTLGAFAAANTNFATGAPAFPGVQTAWNQNDVVVYRFTLTLQNNSAAIGLTSGPHSFTWEAQNQ